MWCHIKPYQLGPAFGKINTNQWFFKGNHLTSLYLTGLLLPGHIEVRHSSPLWTLGITLCHTIDSQWEVACDSSYWVVGNTGVVTSIF